VQAELDATKGSVREQLKEKDVKINELIEELGNTQAIVSEKPSSRAPVPPPPPPPTPLREMGYGSYMADYIKKRRREIAGLPPETNSTRY